MCLFFFFKQKTAYEMRISDWSSDVCSANLAQRHQQVQAGDARRARAGGGDLDVLDLLASDLQRVEHGRTDDDRGAMLVVVEHRDLHPLAQLALDDVVGSGSWWESVCP